MISRYTQVLFFQVLGAIAGFITYWQISHFVDAKSFTVYSLYLSLISFVALVLMGWPTASIILFGSEEWEKSERLGQTLATRFFLYVVTGLLCVGIAWIANPYIMRWLDTSTSVFPWVVIGVIFLPAVDIAVYAHMATGNPGAYGYAPFVVKFFLLAALAAAAMTNHHVNWTFLVSWALVGYAVTTIITLALLPSRAWQCFKPSLYLLRRMLGYSWAIPAGATAGCVVNWVDTWMIRGFLGPEKAGIYTWAYQVVSLGAMAFTSLGATIQPRIVQARLQGEAEYLSQFGKRAVALSLLSGLCGLAVLPIVHPLLVSLAGETYQASYTALLILLSTLSVRLSGYLLNPLLSSFETLVPKGMAINVVAAVINVAGDLLLVPHIGIVGPAISTFVVYFVTAVLQALLVCRSVAKVMPGIRFPRPILFAAGSFVMVPGIVFLKVAPPFYGEMLCLVAAVIMLAVARRSGLLSAIDAGWFELPWLPPEVKRLLVVVVSWLSGGQSAETCRKGR